MYRTHDRGRKKRSLQRAPNSSLVSSWRRITRRVALKSDISRQRNGFVTPSFFGDISCFSPDFDPNLSDPAPTLTLTNIMCFLGGRPHNSKGLCSSSCKSSERWSTKLVGLQRCYDKTDHPQSVTEKLWYGFLQPPTSLRAPKEQKREQQTRAIEFRFAPQ
jgi:hypothetical protein